MNNDTEVVHTPHEPNVFTGEADWALGIPPDVNVNATGLLAEDLEDGG